MRRLKLIAIAFLGLIVAGSVFVFQHFEIESQAGIFTGNAARLMCGGVFVSGRTPEHVHAEDLARKTSPGKYLGFVQADVDFAEKTVTGSLYGFFARTAIYREGVGCTIAQGKTPAQLRAQGEGVASTLPPADPNEPWPNGDATSADDLPSEIDAAALTAAMDFAFAEPDPERPRRTRAALVVHRGRIVAERYAPGFDMTTRHISNSVAKSFTCTLIGILVGQGKLDVHARAPIAEWSASGDPRGAITLDNLLRMSSGLQFEENYTSVRSDITLQFTKGDPAGYAAAKSLDVPPGTRWQYSTGTSNILARIVRENAAPTLPEAFAFPRRALFDKLGMRHTTFQVDAVGNFTGGGSVLASARDYARLGLLYLEDGMWSGERILPQVWVAYVRTPTAHVPEPLGYGAQFWLNTGTNPNVRRWPNLPADTYAMNGHDGQHVFIVPSRQAVVVRVGLSEFGNWKMDEFVALALEALPTSH